MTLLLVNPGVGLSGHPLQRADQHNAPLSVSQVDGDEDQCKPAREPEEWDRAGHHDSRPQRVTQAGTTFTMQ